MASSVRNPRLSMLGLLALARVTLPESTSPDGIWSVRRFTVDKEAAAWERVRAFQHGGRYVPEGTYTQLLRKGTVVMSDTPDELCDHWSLFSEAVERGGRVLVHGLGLGCLIRPLLAIGAVEQVTIKELDPRVIALVAPHYLALAEAGGGRLVIEQGDAYQWKPARGERWSIVWHDVWDNLCSDNLAEMGKLHRRFGRRCDWQGSWGRAWCEYQRDRERRAGW